MSSSSGNLPATLASPPPSVPNTLVSFPAPHVLLVTLDRPAQLNAIPRPQHFAMERLWEWFDGEPSMRVAVLTGRGRAFCAGADLKEWDRLNRGDAKKGGKGEDGEARGDGAPPNPHDRPSGRFPRGGFGGMSNRAGMKPVVAAVNGICLGGGMEMVVNCDVVVADGERAVFGLPEVTIGVVALAGALPRLSRTVGRQRAMEMALGGGRYDADTMRAWGLVNEVVMAGGGEDGVAVVRKALEWAGRIAGNSPDAVIVSREGVKLGMEGVNAEVGTEMLIKGWYERIEKGENMLEGVRSFVERRKPVWRDTKL